MRHAVWKLSALAGVVGIGLLVVVQAQRGLDKTGQPEGEKNPSALQPGQGAPGAGRDPALPPQTEPFGPESFRDDTEPVPAAAKALTTSTSQGGVPAGYVGAGGIGGMTGGQPAADSFAADDPFAGTAAIPQAARRQPSLRRIEQEEVVGEVVEDSAAMPRLPAEVTDEPVVAGNAAGGAGPRLLFNDVNDAESPAELEPAVPSENVKPVKNEQNESNYQDERPAVQKTLPADPFNAPQETLPEIPLIDRPVFPRKTPELPPVLDETDPADFPARTRGTAVESELPARREPRTEPAQLPPASDALVGDDADDFQGGRVRPAPSHQPHTGGVVIGEPEAAGTVEEPPAFDRRAPQGTQRPQLTIDKIAPENAVVGQPLVYHILIRNIGAIPAHQVVVEDRIPRGVQLKGTIPQAESDGTRLFWKLGTLDPAREKRISIRVVPLGEGVVGSVATVKFSADVGSQTVITAPKLRFELVAPGQATLGAAVAFTFRVTNVGRSDATSVIIRNVLPAGLRHPDGDDLEYEVGTLPAGKVKEVQLTLTAAQQGRTVNRAVVTADGGVSVEAHAPLDVLGPSLTVSRTGPKRLFLNKSGIYRNTVANTGANAVANVNIVETVPPGMDFVGATAAGLYDPARRTVTWKLDRIDAGQSQQVEVTLTSVSRGSQISVVRAGDASGASGEAMGTTHVSGVAALAIHISEIPAPVEVGERVTCRVRVLNRGTDAASNVRATIAIPHGMQLLSVKGPGNHRETAADAGNTARQLSFAPIAQLDPHGETVIDLTLQARRPGEARLLAQVQCDQMSQPLNGEEATMIVSTQE